MWDGSGGTTPSQILSSILADPQLAKPLNGCVAVNVGSATSGDCNSFSAAAVPEPGTYALFGTGLLALLAWKRRRQ